MYRNLFVPVDGSDLADKAMRSSVDLARQLGAAITAFVAEPDMPLPHMGTNPTAYNQATDAHVERTDAHAKAVLGRFEKMALADGVGFSGHHLRTDNVDRAIVEMADRHGCDMIVMVTHGRGAFGELLFGSHTKSVLSHSALPLLILH
jgi:nucleotide-binding universal stress UspA family protein